MRFSIFFIGLLVTAGCAKESGSSSSPSNPQSPAKTDSKTNEPQVLKIYDGTDQSLNVLQAVNVNPGQLSFDFTFKPMQNVELSFPVLGGKYYLVGCKESDVATVFEVFHPDAGGKLDAPSSFPVYMKQGLSYVIRANLYLKTSCLGLRYNFAIQSARQDLVNNNLIHSKLASR